MTELCRQADAAADGSGQHVYLESSPAGRATYERFGFEARGSFTTVIKGEDYVDCCMAREPRGGSAGTGAGR
ncbi:hypothetical protein MN608_11164 [Microdochium nivale]|nr:hypothetical protein MN608_11164 [Microdochium nivale]